MPIPSTRYTCGRCNNWISMADLQANQDDRQNWLIASNKTEGEMVIRCPDHVPSAKRVRQLVKPNTFIAGAQHQHD